MRTIGGINAKAKIGERRRMDSEVEADIKRQAKPLLVIHVYGFGMQ